MANVGRFRQDEDGSWYVTARGEAPVVGQNISAVQRGILRAFIVREVLAPGEDGAWRAKVRHARVER